ncbi:MAG: 3-hydroxyacyl-CoA dehydrogenase NAD-binding domain-containing protein [Solirubrobacteraceae bacterium]
MTAEAQPAQVIGVLGAGTMGAGIAQLACRAGARTLLHDPIPQALQRGAEKARGGLEKEAAKGRITAEQARAAAARLEVVAGMEALAPCDLVIEAAPELPELKREIYGRLSEIVSGECVLATNTSSLPVTGIAAGATNPERVVGMHFFNPAPLMALVEVIAGLRSSEGALALADATGRAMGKTVIRATDGPGFLVNRCNRPFGLEALRLLGERVADIETIDRIVRLGGGFRMGPFELSDLVGVDTGFDVARSFYELSFGEPRWRPSPIQAQRVAAGLHGRKSGRGYYDYSGDSHRPADPEPPEREGDAVVRGSGPVAEALRVLAPGASGPEIVVEGLGGTVEGKPFYALPSPARDAAAQQPILTLVEVTGQAGERAFAGLGLHTARVQPSAVGVLPRIVCQVINECAFALGEGVGSARDIDAGMTLGMNYPRGPFAWADAIGREHVVAVLDALWEEYREERYRMAPALRCQ